MSNAGEPGQGPVLVDTDVFSKLYVPASLDAVGRAWKRALTGRTVVIAVQTNVELRIWPMLKGWGEKRSQALSDRLIAFPAIEVTDRVQDAYVDLAVWARKSGHAIWAKDHTGDRWIAATAMAYGLELAAIDGIYDNIDGLMRIQP